MKSIAIGALFLVLAADNKPVQLDPLDWSKGENPAETRKILADKYQGKLVVVAGRITVVKPKVTGPPFFQMQVTEGGKTSGKKVEVEFMSENPRLPGVPGSTSRGVVWTIVGTANLAEKESGNASRHIKLERVKLIGAVDLGDSQSNRRERR